MEAIQTDQVNLIDHVVVVMVAHGALEDVHLRAGSQQDGTSQVILVEGFLHRCKTVKKLCSTLVVSDVDHLVRVQDVRVLHVLLDRVFYMLQHGWHILGAHFSKGPVPECLWGLHMVMMSMLQTMGGSAIVAEPDIVACLIQLNRHGLAVLWRREPRIS